jgi:TRAP-type C4-dicarboxylate transport system substrate-binding protein
MKQARFMGLIFAAIILAFSNAPASAANWKMAHIHPPASDMAKYFNDFAAKVKERTEGRLTITLYAGGTMIPAAEAVQAAMSGVVEIINTNVPYSASTLPGGKIVTLPMLCTSIEKSAAVLNACRPILARDAENKGLLTLWMTSIDPARLLTSNKPVRSLDDVRGMKIRVVDATSSAHWKALGAVPVMIAAPELYTALERKTVDGAQITVSYAITAKLLEVLKYAIWDGLTAGGNLGYVNKAAFNALSDKDKKIFMEEAAQVEKMVNSYTEKAEKESRTIAEAQGVKTIDLSQEELKRWVDKSIPLWDEIIATAGPSGKDLLVAAKKAVGLK